MPDYVSAAIEDERRRPRTDFLAADPRNPTNLAAVARQNLAAGQAANPNWQPVAGEIVAGGRGIRRGTGEVFTGEQPVGEVIIGPRPERAGMDRIGTPLGSRAVTPATQGQVPPGGFAPATPPIDTDRLINTAIARRQELQAQRGELTARRAQLIDQMGKTPLGRRGKETPQHKAIAAELRGLDASERNLARQETFANQEAQFRMTAAFRGAEIADKALGRQRDTTVAEQSANLMTGLAQIEATHQHGTPEFREAVTNLVNSNRMGLRSAAAAARVREASDLHDKEEIGYTRKIGAQLIKRGFTPDQFSAATNIRATNAVEGSNLKTIESSRATEGKNIAFDVGGQTFVLPRQEFNMYAKTFRPEQPAAVAPAAPDETAPAAPDRRPAAQTVSEAVSAGRIVLSPEQAARRAAAAPAAPPPAAAPTAAAPAAAPTPTGFPAGGAAAPAVATTDPRMDLARRALNDPNASEAHKAAARKILGQ